MLEIKELVKSYGDSTALSGVSLCIDSKGIYTILAAKGNGKTTLARLICGCEDATSGEVMIGSEQMSRRATELKRKIRLVPRELCLEPTMSAVEYLNFTGDVLGVAPDKRYRQIKEALEIVGLESAQNVSFAKLTLAENARLSLAAALIGNPEYIVIDDTFSGLDDGSRAELWELLCMLGKIKTVLLLSSDPVEAKRLSETVFIMSAGKIALSGKIAEIEEKLNSTCEVYITVRGDGERVLEAVRGLGCVVSARISSSDANNVNVIAIEHYPDGQIKDKLFAALAEIGAPMLSIRSITLTLSDVFMSLSKPIESENTAENGKKKLERRKSK